MNDLVAKLYEDEPYPGMSHPVGHPSAMAASALFGGLRTPPLATARILDIGCSQGHHVTMIAQHLPKAQVRAMDIAGGAIDYAKKVASEAGVKNIEFFQADLRDWSHWREEGVEYDYIIAHGMLSWVDDECKSALLRICRESLSPSGVAMISYNTLPGWAMRQSLSQMTQALRQVPIMGGTAMKTLEHLDRALEGRTDEYGKYLQYVVRDAAKKGEQILSFDDLAPINDPFYFSQFVHLAEKHGLRYVGESDMGLDQADFVTEGAVGFLSALAGDHLLQQQTQDLLTGRTFRTSLLCRDDAPVSEPSGSEVFDLCLETTEQIASIGNATYDEVAEAVGVFAYGAVRLSRLSEMLPHIQPKVLLGCVTRLVAAGLARLVKDEAIPANSLPDYPALSPLNQIYLRDEGIVIDRLHRPLKLSVTDREIVARFDGNQYYEEHLKRLAPDSRKGCEALMFYMNQRGVLH